MTTQTGKAICNACKVILQPVADAETETWGCPVCGVHDTRENVTAEVHHYMQEMAARQLQDKAKGIADQHPWIKFSGDPVPQGVYRFILADEPQAPA